MTIIKGIGFIECEDGRYGINCSGVCGHCVVGYCHKETGDCDAGCLAGYNFELDKTCHKRNNILNRCYYLEGS